MLTGLLQPRAERLPRRVFLYGTHGIGKSTFGACAPKPVFVPTEDGQRDLRPLPACFPVAKNWGEFMANLWQVATGEHEFETVVIDTADWLETIINNQVCADGNKEALTDFSYGKGYGKLEKYWGIVIDTLSKCQMRGDNGLGKNMWVVVLAHSEVVKVTNPNGDNYDKYQPALHKTCGPMWMEWADEVLFGHDRIAIVERDDGSKRADGRGERVINTTERPGHHAKNRLSLPDEMPLAFASYWEAVQAAYARQDAELGL